MKRLPAASIIVLASILTFSCSDNRAAMIKSKAAPIKTEVEPNKPAVKKDGPAIATIETETYLLKLHRAFDYDAPGSSNT